MHSWVMQALHSLDDVDAKKTEEAANRGTSFRPHTGGRTIRVWSRRVQLFLQNLPECCSSVRQPVRRMPNPRAWCTII